MIDTHSQHTGFKFKRVVKTALKALVWLISIPVLLLLLIILLLQFPKIQTYVTGKATHFLSDKIHAKVMLKKITIAFPKSIELQELYVEDQQADTLLYLGNLKVDVNLWDLLSKKIVLNNVELTHTTGHISRKVNDTSFNFDFIVNAFVKPDTTQTENVKDTTQAAWEFGIKNVELHEVYFTYHDVYGGMNADVKLGDFETSFKTFDLSKQSIAVNSIRLSDTRVIVSRGMSHVVPKPKTPSKPFNYGIAVNAIELSMIHVVYRDVLNKQNAILALGELLVKPEKIDLQHARINLQSISLSNTTASFTMDKSVVVSDSAIKIVSTDSVSPSPNWVVALDKLDLYKNNFSFDNNSIAKTKTGIDYNHIHAKNVSIHATDITGSAKYASIKLEGLSFEEQCGLQLKNMKANIVYDTTHVDIAKLEIETNRSMIKDHLSIRYKSIESIGENIGNLYVSAQLKKSRVAVKDLLLFIPQLATTKSLNLDKNAIVLLSTDIKGIINDLTIREFELAILNNTTLKLKGSLRQVLQPDNLSINLAVLDVTSSREELFSIISKEVIPSTVVLPETFNVKGNLEGYFKNFNASLALTTSIGNAEAHVTMNPEAGNKEQPYSGEVKLVNFDAGELLNQKKLLGPVSMTATFDGSGLDAKHINTDINLDVEKALVNNYEYTHLLAGGKIVDKSFTGKASINDKNIVFNFDGLVNFDSLSPQYVFTFDLKGMDLKALHFTTEDTRISTFIQSNIRQQGDNITGKASVKNTLMIKNNRKYPIDSIVLNSTLENGISDIKVQSEIVDVNFKGNINLKELPSSIEQHINRYFNMQQPQVKENLKPQKFDFKVNLKDPTLIVGNLIPSLEKLTPSYIKGNYDSEAKKIVADVSVPQIKYSGIDIDSLKFAVTSDPASLNYALTIAEVSNPTIKFENTSLRGEVKSNSLGFQLSTSRDDSIKLLAIGGVLKSMNKAFELTINPGLILNAQTWNVDPANSLTFVKEGLMANRLILSNGPQLISANSLSKSPEAPLELKFKDFDLSTISKLLENKKELVKGNMNGTVVLESQQNTSAFSSDLVIRDFVFQSVPIGTIKLKADNKEHVKVYNVDMNVEGNGNNIDVKGSYALDNHAEALNFLVDIKNLNLATVEPFTFGQVTRMSGNVEGKLNVTGSASMPALDGSIHFNKSAFNPQFIDSYLTVPDSKLNFSSNKIIFPDFTVFDSLNNKAIVSGSVDIKDFKNINLDLRVRSDNFLALNTTKRDNPLYFGTVFLDSDISIKGGIDDPDLKVKAKLNKGSTITYVKPESQVGKEDNKGIVEFVDSLNYDKAIMTRKNDTLKQVTTIKGIDLDAIITFDKTVELKMLVDQVSGDSLYIVGGGTLNFTLDKSGKTTLTGKYKIDDGGYHLSISDVVRRDFRIEPGSSVSWSGDILDAYVDIKAIYTIKTSPIDLIQNDLAGVDELERNKYRNMLTFLVYLKMSGFLSTPEISFDIQLAPKDKGAVNGTVNAKLEELRGDETQLNKQVFALLTLRRFISDNPLDNGGGGGGLSSTSRTSASKVLTQQLSTLSQKYVKVVDLDLGVNSFEDYSTGQEEGRTQLQVGVSKQLFKDKVTVRVGGNIELEGERAKQNNASDVAGNISVDYKLTDDGRYKLRGFRLNQYENPIEGEITKTGVGVVYVRNYNKLRELFAKPKSANKQSDLKTK